MNRYYKCFLKKQMATFLQFQKQSQGLFSIGALQYFLPLVAGL